MNKYLILVAANVLQTLFWVVMSVLVLSSFKALGSNVLYVTEISHWALVLGGFQLTFLSISLYQSHKHNNELHRKLDQIHDHVKPKA